MPIVPDTKDWTWVIDRPCPECGFDASSVAATEVASLLRENAATWPGILERQEQLTRRPSDDRWSTLEYACHVRDVFGLYEQRLRMILDEDDPVFPNWDQDETAVSERYNEQDPSTVARDLVAAGHVLADSFDTVAGDQWQRTGRRSDGARFTVDTFSRYMVHDPIHHVWDVEQVTAPPA
jgi:hypothetical protein